MKIEDLKSKLLNFNQIENNIYLDEYCKLIFDNITTKKQSFKTQSHHIIPKSLFKLNKVKIDNSQYNLVNLNYKDHLLAHYLLCLCARDELFKYYMFMSIQFITSFESISGENLNQFVNGLDEYQRLYEEHLIKRGELTSYYLKGTTLSNETKEKIRESNKRTKQDMIPVYNPNDETTYTFIHLKDLDYYSKLGYIRGRPKALSKKMGEGQKGKIIPNEQKIKFREAKLGKICIYKDDKDKLVDESLLENFISNGWKLGRSYKSRKAISEGSFGKKGTFIGKHHTDESKKKISKTNSGGKYVHLNGIVKHIKEEELSYYLSKGWQLGNPNSNKNKGLICWVTNGRDNKLIKIEELDNYLKLGYYRGRTITTQ